MSAHKYDHCDQNFMNTGRNPPKTQKKKNSSSISLKIDDIPVKKGKFTPKPYQPAFGS